MKINIHRKLKRVSDDPAVNRGSLTTLPPNWDETFRMTDGTVFDDAANARHEYHHRRHIDKGLSYLPMSEH
jgi:hypothetical protein